MSFFPLHLLFFFLARTVMDFFVQEEFRFQLCNKLADGWTRVLMEESRAPYVYGRDTVNGVPDQLVWISHDDVQSYTEKVSIDKHRAFNS